MSDHLKIVIIVIFALFRLIRRSEFSIHPITNNMWYVIVIYVIGMRSRDKGIYNSANVKFIYVLGCLCPTTHPLY